jgi:hypothetical protein
MSSLKIARDSKKLWKRVGKLMLQLNATSDEICAKETRALPLVAAPEIAKKKESIELVG